MANVTYAGLAAETTVQDTDLLASFRGASGPLKRITALILKAYFTAGSLLLDGSQPMSGALEVIPGSASAPGVAFVGSLTSGLYSPTTDEVGLTAGGVQVALGTLGGMGIFRPVAAKSSGYTVLRADVGTLFACSSTFTLTLTAASTLGVGHNFQVHNTGTGFITIDPDSAETIDGRTTIIVYPGECFQVVCIGGGVFLTVGRAREVLISNVTTGSVASLEFTDGFIDTELQGFQLDFATSGATSNATLSLALKVGSSYPTSTFVYGINTTDGSGGGVPGQFVGNNVAGIRLTNKENTSAGSARIYTGQAVSGSRATVNIDSMDGNEISMVGTGYVGTSSAAITAAKLAYSSGNINSGSVFTLRGTR